MKAIVVVIAAVAACAVVNCAPQDQYTNKYDNIKLDEILQSDRLLNNYIKCLLDKGPCTPDAVEFKKILPDALENECVKCNDVQKDGAKKVAHFILLKKPDVWQLMEKKYDPEGKFRKRYEHYKDQLSPEERAALGL